MNEKNSVNFKKNRVNFVVEKDAKKDPEKFDITEDQISGKERPRSEKFADLIKDIKANENLFKDFKDFFPKLHYKQQNREAFYRAAADRMASYLGFKYDKEKNKTPKSIQSMDYLIGEMKKDIDEKKQKLLDRALAAVYSTLTHEQKKLYQIKDIKNNIKNNKSLKKKFNESQELPELLQKKRKADESIDKQENEGTGSNKKKKIFGTVKDKMFKIKNGNIVERIDPNTGVGLRMTVYGHGHFMMERLGGEKEISNNNTTTLDEKNNAFKKPIGK